MFDIAAICLSITALLAYVNHRFVGLPTAIGVMAIALLLSLGIVGLDALGLAEGLRQADEAFVRSIHFSDVLMQGMLSMLLFAGAMHVDLQDLKRHGWAIAGLALVGTLASTLAIGLALWYALPLAGVELPLAYCLVFGALISPTDPVAVLGILKSAGAPPDLETVITGESLFNDGVGVVLFVVLAGALQSGTAPSLAHGAELLLVEAGGGILFGLVLGWVTYQLLKSVDHYQVEVLLTLAAVVGGYALASRLHVSGPLAMVVAGLAIGNHGRARAMSQETRRYVDMFWELVDEILNAVLFVLVGMEVLLLEFSGPLAIGGAIAIAITLAARLATVGAPMAVLHGRLGLPRGSWRVLTWGGLRGGISVALALSLPRSDTTDVLLALTYSVVVFSILVQGLTIGAVVRRLPGG